ncbi:MAG: cysE [Capsulimonas sp.]|nr:cysE [Capsulimonas sp.]
MALRKKKNSGPAKLWWWSCLAQRRKLKIVARILKTINFIAFKAILPPQAEIHPDIKLEHYGMGIVIHPNVVIGRRVKIYHNVTLAAETWIGSPHKIVIGDDVVIGAGAIVVARPDQGLTVGNNARIGAGSVVTKDVPENATVVGSPARVIAIREPLDNKELREDAATPSGR